MAKQSAIQKNKRRQKLVLQFAEKRAALKAIAKDSSRQPEERFAARMKLAKLPRNSSKTRIRNRCEVTGRRRAFLRRFRLSRITFREMASHGMIPGVTKSSW